MAGRVQILTCLHGQGPGSIWARSAAPGDLTPIIGPQSSLDLIGHSQPTVFFGDETSFAAAKTLQSHLTPGHTARFIFETSSGNEARAVADRLELRDAQSHEPTAGWPIKTGRFFQRESGTVISHNTAPDGPDLKALS